MYTMEKEMHLPNNSQAKLCKKQFGEGLEKVTPQQQNNWVQLNYLQNKQFVELVGISQ